jgi:hypothetical protein
MIKDSSFGIIISFDRLPSYKKFCCSGKYRRETIVGKMSFGEKTFFEVSGFLLSGKCHLGKFLFGKVYSGKCTILYVCS